jgi:hypothetical protein
MTTPQFRLSEDRKNILYNFPIEPNVYRYNIENKKNEVFGGEPKLNDKAQSTIASPVNKEDSKSIDRKLLHYLQNIRYYPLVQDVNKRFYFRAYIEPLTKTEKGFDDPNKRRRYLTIFDSQFNVINTLSLNDRNYSLNDIFSTKEGLYIPCPNGKNIIRFKLFKFRTI